MIIAVINNKGGTGKTTTSVNLGGAFAELGYEVLVVDLDPQASASLYLGATSGTLEPSVSNVLFDGIGVRSAIRSSPTPGLHLLTADPGLYNTDLILANTAGRENKLNGVLEAVEDDYDFILLDCPPAFSMVSVNALVAADAYILPVTPEYLPLEDLDCMMGMIEELRKNMAVDVEMLGIVLNMTPTAPGVISARTRTARGNIRKLRTYFDEDVFATEISADTTLAESPSYGNTVFGTAPSCRSAKQYRELAQEFIARCGILKLKAESRRIARMRRQQRASIRRKGFAL
jgi:chromosome partitioning protein